jgi:uncharacterized protein with NAD-binding domain and iron-sulfur cluster
LVDRSAAELRELFWRDVCLAYDLRTQPVPPARIVKERRATFLASPAQLERRPQAKTQWINLLLAGDYVDTGLPATIEGAIRSGFAAALLALERLQQVSRPIGLRRVPRSTTSNPEAEQQQDRALP